jgi:hypothetical protein
MNASALPAQTETETTDRQALLLMLSYVEAECRRLGAEDAARHAALAACLLPEIAIQAPVPAPAHAPGAAKRGRGLRLH